MKLATLTNPQFRAALAKLMAAQVPLKVAYKLHNVDKVSKEELDKYEKLRIAALEQFGKRKEDGTLDADERGNVNFEDGKAQEFVDQLNELLNVDVEMSTFKLEDFGDNVALSANELASITPLLET